MATSQGLTLLLEDGTRFDGQGFGYIGETDGEVVFNTGMTGYPEALTDPSYRGQILTMTYPLIGNYGVPDVKKYDGDISTFFESDQINIRALIVSEYCDDPYHWNKKETLSDWMKSQKIPGIAGIDTRHLTQILREKGAMLGKIVKTQDAPKTFQKGQLKVQDPNKTNLVAEVCTSEVKIYEPEVKAKKTILLFDCGVKYNIIRNFLQRGVKVIRVPYNYNLSECEYDYDGVFVSPGPGDPKMLKETIEQIKYALSKKHKIFGICLGHQLLSLAIGADTYKMKYGHRGVNQPCIDRFTNRCYITSQNHGFAVDSKKLPRGWKEWFVNANDDTSEGLMHSSGDYFSVQFHPESNPGPRDAEFLFDKFVDSL